jgi:hypothetical protein
MSLLAVNNTKGVLAFLLENNPDIWETATKNGGQIIDIAGGVAVMFAQFILCFWYGRFIRWEVRGSIIQLVERVGRDNIQLIH